MMELIKRIAAIIVVVILLNTFGLLRLAIVLVIMYFAIELGYRIYLMFKERDYDDERR